MELRDDFVFEPLFRRGEHDCCGAPVLGRIVMAPRRSGERMADNQIAALFGQKLRTVGDDGAILKRNLEPAARGRGFGHPPQQPIRVERRARRHDQLARQNDLGKPAGRDFLDGVFDPRAPGSKIQTQRAVENAVPW